MDTSRSLPNSETSDEKQKAQSAQSGICSPVEGDHDPSVHKDTEYAEAYSLSKEFASEMLLKSDSRHLMLTLVDACRKIFTNCNDLAPDKVVEIREIMRQVRNSDVGLPENMSLSNIEYIHVLEVLKAPHED